MRIAGALLGLALLIPAAALAATAGFHSNALSARAGEEIAVIVENRCAGPAQLQVAIVAADRSVLTTERRALAAGRRAAVTYRLPTERTVFASMTVACAGAEAPNPLILVVVRGPDSPAPRIAGDVYEGTGI